MRTNDVLTGTGLKTPAHSLRRSLARPSQIAIRPNQPQPLLYHRGTTPHEYFRIPVTEINLGEYHTPFLNKNIPDKGLKYKKLALGKSFKQSLTRYSYLGADGIAEGKGENRPLPVQHSRQRSAPSSAVFTPLAYDTPSQTNTNVRPTTITSAKVVDKQIKLPLVTTFTRRLQKGD